MSISEMQRPGTATSRHALYGLALPSNLLRALQKRGIYCTPGVSLEHQHLAGRYVLRGVESGGAVSVRIAGDAAGAHPKQNPLVFVDPVGTRTVGLRLGHRDQGRKQQPGSG
jgi:hypothetical protein